MKGGVDGGVTDAGIWQCHVYLRMLSSTCGLFLQMLGAPTVVTSKTFPNTGKCPLGRAAHLN